MRKECGNESIVAKIVGVEHENDTITYTSQLNVTVSSEIIGQNITCQYDDDTSTQMSQIPVYTVGTIELTYNIIEEGMLITISTYKHTITKLIIITAQFNSSTSSINYFIDSMMKTITFTWNPFDCPIVLYNILASNCGRYLLCTCAATSLLYTITKGS